MSDVGTLVQPPPTNTSSASTSQPNEYNPSQGFQPQYAHIQQQQQPSHIVYQLSPQQQIKQEQQIKAEVDTTSGNINYESQNNVPQNSFQHDVGAQNGNRSYEMKNGADDGNRSAENGNVTFTTLTTFRTSNGAPENGAPNDEYVPNGGNLLFGLPPGLLMPTSGEENGSNGSHALHAQQLPVPPAASHRLVPGPNGLMLAPPPHLAQQHHGLYPPPQGIHQPPPHFQMPPHFMPNLHAPLSHHQPPPHMMHELGGSGLMDPKRGDEHMIGAGGMIAAPSSSDASPMSHAMGGNQHGHFSTDNGASTASSGGGHSTPSSSAEDATDPYLCVWCSFKTIYKGNMKRHLISCHGGITDELLRKLSFDVDRLRKLCPNRPHVNELPIMPKAPRQSSGQGNESVEGGDHSAPKATKTSKSNGGGSGRKRSTNGANNSAGADNGNRGRPRKNAKGEKTLKEEKSSPLPDEVFKKDGHDEMLRQNGAASSSPSTASIPARLNSKTSASSAAGSPSLMALSSGVAATSLMSPPPNSMAPTAIFAGDHSLLQTAPQSMAQLQHAFSNPNQQFGSPFSPPHPSLFMVMNPGNGAQGGPPAFQAGGLPHPLMVSVPHSQSSNHPNFQHLAPAASHFQQLDSMASAGFPQPIYISSGVYPPPPSLQLPSQPQVFVPQSTFQSRLQQLGGVGQPPPQSPNFATLSTIKTPIKECGTDSRISLHSYNTGVDL